MFRELSLWWSRFSPLEEQLLAAVRGALGVKARELFDAQVAAINHVQRLPPGWEEIDFYCLRRGKPAWLESVAFPRSDEFPLARVRFSVGGVLYESVLTVVSGHIFDFATGPGPREIAFERWSDLTSAEALADPLETGH